MSVSLSYTLRFRIGGQANSAARKGEAAGRDFPFCRQVQIELTIRLGSGDAKVESHGKLLPRPKGNALRLTDRLAVLSCFCN